MRRERFFRMARAEAVALLRDAPVVHVAAADAEGAPILRTLNHVVVGEAVCFHGSPVGEKTLAVGRPVVVAAEEIVAAVPSYFVDPERACPATTLYRSVQLHGRLEAVAAPADKARVLAALMTKYQPEGGYAPIDPAHPSYGPLYAKEVAALLVTRVALEALDGKSKLAQNRSPDERRALCERLWARGLPGDPRAIELVRAASPDTPTPAFLWFEPTFKNSNLGSSRPPTLHCALDPADVEPAVQLLAPAYWNAGLHPPARIAAALVASTAAVAARDGEGRLIGCARAISDDQKLAWVYDVVVAPAWRGAGVGLALMRLLLDHPRLRSVARVCLQTADAQSFYRKLGFVEADEAPRRPHASTAMLRIQR
jgi:nitroimidazol reductase NimA-like FMN-containing flavoprotein (pyridoxamine 5'-phosphate oxidase superfamily)/N-acetylglutamate synthase-like GNAT family acetyltransferase